MCAQETSPQCAPIDAALAAQNAVVAAQSLGLRTVYIGAMRNDPVRVAELLGLPPRAFVVFGLCVGYADPESALQSGIWAMSQGDAKTARASFAPEARELADWRDKSDTDLSTDIKREMEKVTAFKIISKDAISEDTAVLTVMVQGVDHNEVTPLKLQRIGGDWKLAGSVKEAPTTK